MNFHLCARFSGLLTALFLVSSASAQDSATSVRWFQLAPGEMQESWVSVVGEKEPVKVEWLTTQPSQPYKVTTHGGTLKIYSKKPLQGEKMAADDIHNVTLPTPADEVLLLAWSNSGKNKYVAIKDHYLKANFDDWIAINTSSAKVALKVGATSDLVRLEPGKSVIFRPRIDEGKGVEVVAASAVNDKPKIFFSSYWPAYQGQRTMIVIYQDGERMRARRIGDRFVKEEKAVP